MKKKTIFYTLLITLFISTGLSAEIRAKVYSDICHEGNVQHLYGSQYDINDLYWVGNDKISSIIVYAGWEVELYEHDNFEGSCYAVTSSIIDLRGVDFNDKVSSIKIVPRTYPAIHPSDKVLPGNFLSATSVVAPGTMNTVIDKFDHPTMQGVARLHSQGIGWDNITGNYVYTGCRSNTNAWGFQQGCVGESHIVLFGSDLHKAIDAKVSAKYDGLNGGKSHPSAIQITNSIFPVAIEKTGEVGCYIEFYRVHQNHLEYLGEDVDMKTVEDHIGALAYANVNGNTYMLGATTNGKKIHIWSANGVDNYENLSYLKTIHPFNIEDCGVDKNWSEKYQSLWLGKIANGKIVLMAAHGNNHWKNWKIRGTGWIDLWEINSLAPGVTTRLTKLHKKQTKRWGRSHFYEGTTFGPGNEIIVAPNDFTLDNSYELKSEMYELEYRWYSWCQTAVNPGTTQDDSSFEIVAAGRRPASADLALQNDDAFINYFPNPFEDQITIDISIFNNESITGSLSITDVTGKYVRKINLADLAIENEKLLLNLGDLEDGIYFFTLQNQEYISTQKIVKLNR